MSAIDEIEELEQNLVNRRHSDEVLETADEVEHLFDDYSNAVEFAQAYEDTYNSKSRFYDPVGYAESWHDSFDGDMTGAAEELLYED